MNILLFIPAFHMVRSVFWFASLSKNSIRKVKSLVWCRIFCIFLRRVILENPKAGAYHIGHRGDAMQHSLETYFFTNLAIDTALLTTIARANDCARFRRILLCGFLSASYAVLIECVSNRLSHPLIQILLLVILSILLCGDSELQRWGIISIQLFGGAMILGGMGTTFFEGERFLPAVIGAGFLLISGMLNIRKRRLLSWEVMVILTLHGRTVHFRALIDTGNRLHEPISGLPVLVAESSLLQDFLHSLQIPFRHVSFGGLGGNGVVRCFRPDTVLIRRGDRLVRAPDVWVAVYPGKFPGTSRALAPPAFAVIPGKS